MNDYPDNYKFTSFSVMMSPKIPLASRQTYTFWDMLGDIGGFFDFFRFLLGMVLVNFPTMRINALLAE